MSRIIVRSETFQTTLVDVLGTTYDSESRDKVTKELTLSTTPHT